MTSFMILIDFNNNFLKTCPRCVKFSFLKGSEVLECFVFCFGLLLAAKTMGTQLVT